MQQSDQVPVYKHRITGEVKQELDTQEMLTGMWEPTLVSEAELAASSPVHDGMGEETEPATHEPEFKETSSENLESMSPPQSPAPVDGCHDPRGSARSRGQLRQEDRLQTRCAAL